jgi:hypothetical protein
MDPKGKTPDLAGPASAVGSELVEKRHRHTEQVAEMLLADAVQASLLPALNLILSGSFSIICTRYHYCHDDRCSLLSRPGSGLGTGISFFLCFETVSTASEESVQRTRNDAFVASRYAGGRWRMQILG